MKKRILSGLLSLCLILLSAPAVWRTGISAEAPGETDAPWDGKATTPPEGSGTETDPYRIGTAAEFAWMNTLMTATNNTYFSGAYFVLTADIDCNGEQLRIGTSSKSFGGVFDGKGYTVYNNAVTQNSTPTGLFAFVKGGTVKNLTVTASSVTTYYADKSIKGTAGMIVGSLENGNLIGCTTGSDCRVQAASIAGGLVGIAKNSEIRYCVNNANVEILPSKEITLADGSLEQSQVNVANYSAAGILAWGTGNTVSDCANYGKIVLGNITKGTPGILTVGGIIGYHTAGDIISDCYNCGEVSGNAGTFKARVTVGGICGRTRTGQATVERCYNLSDMLSVTGETVNIGLLVGFVNAKTTLTAKDCKSIAVEGITNGTDGEITIEKAGTVTAENNKIATAEEIAVPVAGIQAKIKANRVARLALIGLQTTEAVGGVYSVRILLGLDHLDYAYYKIVTTATYEKDGATQTANNGGKPLTVAYDTVYAAGEPVSAVRFGSDYLGAIVLSEVPADTAIAFVIRAYVGDAAGNETLVDSVTCQIGNQ